MTADGRAGQLPTEAILGLCDKVLGEVGRRSHRFAWLRAPGSVADAWLPVEAYYPRQRLVVVCRSERAPYDHLFAELVPEHGLRLLQIAPVELGGDAAIAEPLLRRMIARLPAPPDRAAEPETRPRSSRLRSERGQATSPAPRTPEPPRRRTAPEPPRRRTAPEPPRLNRVATARTAPATSGGHAETVAVGVLAGRGAERGVRR